MKNLERNNRNILTMDSASLALIQNLYANDHEPILLPDNTKSSKQRIRYPKTGKINNATFIKIFPNPAKQYVILEYNLKDKFQSGQSAIISIATIDGKHIDTIQLGKQQDQILLSTTTYSSGTYICTLSLSGKHLENQKFTIIQ